MNGAEIRGARRQAVDGGDSEIGGDRVAETAQLERADGLDLDPPVRQPVRSVADEDLARTGGLLEARGEVHGFPGREGGVGLVDDDLAGLDPDPRLEPELDDVVEDAEAGADRALGVVLVRLRDPEGGHDRVAGELLDGAAVRLDAARDAVEERRHPPPGDLRVLPCGKLGRADQVGEQDRRQLALHTESLGTGAEVPNTVFRPMRKGVAERLPVASRRARAVRLQGLRRPRDLSRPARRGRRVRDRQGVRGRSSSPVRSPSGATCASRRRRWPRR